jgi:hypothetical protein
MRRIPSLTVLALVLGLLARTGLAADDKKDDKKADTKKDDKKADTPEKMVKQGQLTGQLLSVNETDKTLEVELTYSIPKLNDGEYRAMLQAQVDYQKAIAKRDVNGARNAASAAAQHQAKLYTYEKKTKKLKLTMIEDVIVRAANPPPQFDDKGQPKKYTKKELDELKGPNKKLPGFETEGLSALRPRQTLALTLVKKKEDKDKEKERPKPNQKLTKEEMEEALLANLPEVSMVMILAEPKE